MPIDGDDRVVRKLALSLPGGVAIALMQIELRRVGGEGLGRGPVPAYRDRRRALEARDLVCRLHRAVEVERTQDGRIVDGHEPVRRAAGIADRAAASRHVAEK